MKKIFYFEERKKPSSFENFLIWANVILWGGLTFFQPAYVVFFILAWIELFSEFNKFVIEETK